MKLKELAKNGEKYSDPTAFKAIQNAEGTADVMLQAGEIWEIRQNVSGSYKNVIVLASHDKITTILQINDIGDDNCIKVNCQGIKYTDPCRLQYAFNDTFCNFVRMLKDEEFEKVMKAVADGLGLVIPKQIPTKEIKKPAIEKVEQTEQPEVNLELIKAKAERDVFKELYEGLLQKVVCNVQK